MDRTLAGEAAIAAVEAEFEFADGAAFIRLHAIERMFRDVQAARFHTAGSTPERIFAGRIALGLSIDDFVTG